MESPHHFICIAWIVSPLKIVGNGPLLTAQMVGQHPWGQGAARGTFVRCDGASREKCEASSLGSTRSVRWRTKGRNMMRGRMKRVGLDNAQSIFSPDQRKVLFHGFWANKDTHKPLTWWREEAGYTFVFLVIYVFQHTSAAEILSNSTVNYLFIG